MTPSARYVMVLLATTGLILGLILGLNLLLGERALGGPKVTRLASEWQQQSKGVTYAPPITAARRFKALRLADRMPGISAMAFGSSTAWGITADAMPEGYGFYNFGVTGNSLANIIGEIEYFLVQYPDRLKLLVVPMEWAIGSVYDRSPPPTMNLAPNAVLAEAEQSVVSMSRKIQDALSYPKVANLLLALRSLFQAPEPLAGARSLFFGVAGDTYQCADGSLARDFDVVNRGQCAGFRYDGSWSFGGEKRLTVARAAALSRAAAAHSSKFSHALCITGGEPNPEYLRRLMKVAQALSQSGAKALFILPPLVPGMEREMAADEMNRSCLARTKQVLQTWAREIDVTIIDAGRAERFGCRAEEFIDEHHAYPECYRRVMNFYFQAQREGRALPGLLQP